MSLPAAVQRRVDAEAGAWARSFADPRTPDPVLRAAVRRFAEGVAPGLLPTVPARAQPAALLGSTALVLAALALVALAAPLAAVPLLVVGAVVLLGVAWSSAAKREAPSVDELRAALGAAAYAGVLRRRTDPYPHQAGRRHPGATANAPAERGAARPLDHATLQGRATYAAAAALDSGDTATVIDL